MKLVMKRAGAGVPSANRITLLRDADGDGVAETRSVFLRGPELALRHGAGGRTLYVANADALVRCPTPTGQTRPPPAPTVKVTDLPAGINHHWTKNVAASADGSKLYVTVGSNSNVAENGMEAEEGRAAIWEVDKPAAPSACSRPACATRTAWPGSRRPRRCGPWSTSATNWAATWCPTT
jgi:glucose/arabinose dehydrogenase